MMTFQQLQYVLEIGNTGTISGAAKNLFVSSSSVSISLNILEKELGYPIFARTPKGFIPTQQGQLVFDYAKQILRSHALLNEVGKNAVRTLRINCTDQLPVAKAFAQLLRENKDRTDLRIECVRYSGSEIYTKLVEHAIDLNLSSGISYNEGSTEKHLRKKGLHSQVLKRVPGVVQVGPGHRLYDADALTPHDLRNECYIDAPEYPLVRNNSFGGNLYIDPNKVIYARSGIRTEILLRGMGYSIGVMPAAPADSPIRSIPLAGCFFLFSATTYSDAYTQPELTRFLQLAQQNLDEAYPNY